MSNDIARNCSVEEDTSGSSSLNLLNLYKAGEYKEFVRGVLDKKLNILIVGSTGSGKTVQLETLLHEITSESDDKMAVIETFAELKLSKKKRRCILFSTTVWEIM